MIELREGDARHRGGRAGQRIALPGGGEAELLAPYLGGRRLWAARLTLPAPLLDYLAEHGEPIRYRHQPEPRPLADYQTIFASTPAAPRCRAPGDPSASACWSGSRTAGSRWPPSSSTPASRRSSAASGPYPERFRVPAGTLAAVRAARRVIAVGTTVVRALETAADGITEGWTRLVVDPPRGVRVVDGILTGWHEPDASHLLMLEAIAGRRLVERSYEAALADGYRWHEFGDSHLLLAG